MIWMELAVKKKYFLIEFVSKFWRLIKNFLLRCIKFLFWAIFIFNFSFQNISKNLWFQL